MGALDDTRAALTIDVSPLQRAMRGALALMMAGLLTAHVGSPDVYWSGRAGPYAIDVVVRPPQVVPGIAEILVHAPGAGIERVTVRPVYWRAGIRGAPSADEAKRVENAPDMYSGRLWLMAGGSYSVHIGVEGRAGRGIAVVPVAAVATGQLQLSGGLRALLVILGTLLVAGIITAVHAAVGESQVAPGEVVPAVRRRRARVAAAIAAAIVALLVLGGAKWWIAEAKAYASTLYTPLRTQVVVNDAAGAPTITLRVVDTNFREGRVSALMPDHGKIAHLFLARVDSNGMLAHLHPEQVAFETLRGPLPPLPPGRYRLFADVVHESGFQRTFVDSLTLAAPLTAGATHLDRDDAWYTGPLTAVSSAASLGDQITLAWTGDSQPVVGRTGVLRFTLRQPSGEPVIVEPYLGMAGHAVVIRDDGKVYVHLHPSGTSAMASALAFTLRDRGDTMPDGRLRITTDAMGMTPTQPLRDISFPYAFPSPGRYRVWVQLRVRDSVRTAGFEVGVRP
jgi:hypothetical protein